MTSNLKRTYFTIAAAVAISGAAFFALANSAHANQTTTNTDSDVNASEPVAYPNLASVPQKPSVSSLEQRAKWRYSLENQRLISEASSSLLESPPLQTAQVTPPSSPYYYPSLVPYASQPAAIIYFPNGGSKLSNRDKQIIDQVADIQSKRNGRLLIVGHASRDQQVVGRQPNYELSTKRAQTVADHLVSNGINPAAILLEARGDLQPRYDERTGSGEAGNRRVEIFLVP